jgi:hypothetical protein
VKAATIVLAAGHAAHHAASQAGTQPYPLGGLLSWMLTTGPGLIFTMVMLIACYACGPFYRRRR